MSFWQKNRNFEDLDKMVMIGDEYSDSDVFKRSRVVNRCTWMPRTWSGVL